MREAVVHSRQTTLRTLSTSPRVIMTVAFGGISGSWFQVTLGYSLLRRRSSCSPG